MIDSPRASGSSIVTNKDSGTVGSQTFPCASWRPVGVLTCSGPATGAFESTIMLTCGGAPVVSMAPTVDPEGPTVSIIGERVTSLPAIEELSQSTVVSKDPFSPMVME